MRMRPSTFPHYFQLDSMDCGPTCLRMIAKYYGRSYSMSYLRERCYIDREGVSIRGISEAAEQIGFRTLAVKVRFSARKGQPSLKYALLPTILHWNQNHFVVAYRRSRSHVWISYPAVGKFKVSNNDVKKGWISDGNKGVALLLQPTPSFYDNSLSPNVTGFSFLLRYLKPYYRLLFQIVLGLIVGSLFQLVVPFLTQSLVDVGIDTKNLDFIYIILIGQLMIFIGQTSQIHSKLDIASCQCKNER